MLSFQIESVVWLNKFITNKRENVDGVQVLELVVVVLVVVVQITHQDKRVLVAFALAVAVVITRRSK